MEQARDSRLQGSKWAKSCRTAAITNIEKAIRTIFSHEGAKTTGVDGISKTSNISQERIIKEVKLRLRRYKPVQLRKVQIPKGNGEFRELTIIYLFDRIA